MAGIRKVACFGPVVWGGVWGHGPELARLLAGRARVVYLDPPVPREAAAPSFQGGERYGCPEGLTVVRRSSRRRVGIGWGLEMEWRNLWALWRSGADCLVSYYPLGSLLALAWCRLTGKRSLLVVADHPQILRSRLAGNLLRTVGLPLAARLARGCLATSSLLLEDLRRHTRRAIMVPNGVDLAKIAILRRELERGKRPQGQPFTVGFVGWFGEWIDFPLVIAAARQSPEARFQLVGDGPARAEAERLAAGLANVEFTGALPHAEVFRRIAGFDLGLVPFRLNELTHRVSPVKLFEYWAMGRPVAATACQELLATAERSGGGLFFVTTPGTLADLIRELREDPAALRKAGRRSLAAVAEYDWERLGERIITFLEAQRQRPEARA